MRRAALLAVPVALLLWSATVRAACTDADAVAKARATAASSCSCATTVPHGRWVACVAGVARDAVAHGMLPPECEGAVVRCAARSACGRPGFVTCCRATSHRTTCHVVRSAGACTAKGGTVGACASCCDACSGGCPTSTTTSTTTTTTATTTLCAPDHCGDGVYQPECGEECDGPQSGSCPTLDCGTSGGPLPCQCCVPPGGAGFLTGFLPKPCCNGCGMCVAFAPHSCACPLEVVDGSCCSPFDELCDYPAFGFSATCCPGLACAKPGINGSTVCCATAGQPCTTGADCCSTWCNAGTGLCD